MNDYPHIVDDQTWGTGIVVFNCNDEPNELNVVAYDDDGNRIAQVERQLAAHGKLLGQASALFDGMDISAATNIRFMSEAGGVAAFSDQLDGQQLDGRHCGSLKIRRSLKAEDLEMRLYIRRFHSHY